MKKIISILLSLALCLGMCPTWAFAAEGGGTPPEGSVARVDKGDVTTYLTANELDAAFATSGNADATFTLLKDVTYEEREQGLTIKINCTLDLGGHTIRSKGEYATALSTYGGTIVTIRGAGTVLSEHGHGLSVGGTATLEGGNFISGAADYGGVNVIGKLIVTGENVVIRNTGGGTGLGVGDAATARLSGGTCEGEKAAVKIYGGTGTLAGLLAEGYAYYNGDTPIALEADGKELTGTVTVKACQHTGEGVCTYTHIENASTHTKTCLACGQTWDPENCAYTFSGATGTCAACGDSVTVEVFGAEGLVYDGTGKEPGVTVTRGGTVLAAGDYTVTYTGNTNAGTATVDVTIGNSQGTYYSTNPEITR